MMNICLMRRAWSAMPTWVRTKKLMVWVLRPHTHTQRWSKLAKLIFNFILLQANKKQRKKAVNILYNKQVSNQKHAQTSHLPDLFPAHSLLGVTMFKFGEHMCVCVRVLCIKVQDNTSTMAQQYQLKWQLDLKTASKQALLLLLLLIRERKKLWRMQHRKSFWKSLNKQPTYTHTHTHTYTSAWRQPF